MVDREPKNIPIHLAFGRHSEENANAVQGLQTIAEGYLSSSETGVVTWFVEAADVTLEKAETVQQARSGGAQGQIDILVKDYFSNSPVPLNMTSKRIFKAMRKAFLKRKKFISTVLTSADGLSRTHSQRLVLALERTSQAELEERKKLNDKELEDQVESDESKFRSDYFLEALPDFKQLIERNLRMAGQDRDQEIAQVLMDEVKNPDVIAEVGHLGAAHTRVYHQLKKNGFNVSRFFPQQEGSAYWFDPATAALRSMALFPNKAHSEDEWLKTIVQYNIYYYLELRRQQPGLIRLLLSKESLGNKLRDLYLRSTIPNVPDTEQGIVKLVYSVTHNYNREAIEEFEQSARKNGIGRAINSLLHD